MLISIGADGIDLPLEAEIDHAAIVGIKPERRRFNAISPLTNTAP